MSAGATQTGLPSQRLQADQSPVRGTVYSYTLVQEAPAGFEAQAPYYLALVELEDGDLITAQLTDIDSDVNIGDAVEMVTRKLTTEGARGMIVYGYKFRPLIK